MAIQKVFTIGISGGTGSGKSSIVDELVSEFPQFTTVLKFDNYYKTHHNLTYDQRCKLNFDEPSAFDLDLMIEHIQKLKDGNDVDSPIYDFKIHDRINDTAKLKANKVLLVEGIFTLAIPEIREMLDTKIYVSVDADVRILRRILRDVNSRNRSLDSVADQYLNTVKPMHEKYVAPSKEHANIIVPQGAFNKEAIKIISNHISKFLYREYGYEWVDINKN